VTFVLLALETTADLRLVGLCLQDLAVEGYVMRRSPSLPRILPVLPLSLVRAVSLPRRTQKVCQSLQVKAIQRTTADVLGGLGDATYIDRRQKGSRPMSEEEKNNGEYEKPESHSIDADELDGVSGGVETGPTGPCFSGSNATPCRPGASAMGGRDSCDIGAGAEDRRYCVPGSAGAVR
jgi:hypothetical protein